MESRSYEVSSALNSDIKISVIPGHFATNHSHVSHYIDMTRVKTVHNCAKLAAKALAEKFSSTSVDTIICMEGMEIIAAYLAQELTNAPHGINAGKDINIISPEYNQNNQMIFRNNVEKMVWNQRVLLLIASATTGKTINRALECIKYYCGTSIGIGAVFSAAESIQGIDIYSVFTEDDVPEYKTYSFSDCPDCAQKKKIDAIVNAFGYLRI